MTLVSKVILSAVIAVAMVMSVTGFVIFTETKNRMSDVLDHQLSSNLEFTEALIFDKREEAEHIVSTLSRNRQIRKALNLGENRGIGQILNDLPNIYPLINYVMIADVDRTVFAVSSRDNLGNKIHSEQLLFHDLDANPMASLEAITTTTIGTPGEDPYLAEMGIKKSMSQWVISPITRKGTNIGWIVISMDWQKLQEGVLQTSVEKLIATDNPVIAALIINQQQHVMISYQTGYTFAVRSYPDGQKFYPEQQSLWKTKTFQSGDLFGELVIIYDREQVFQPLASITNLTVIATLISAILLGLLLYLLLKKGLLQRIQLLHEGSELIGDGNLDYRISDLGQDEIGTLGQSFNKMAANLQKTTTSIDRLDIAVKRREQALADLAEQQFALDQHALVTITDTQGTITYVNNKFAEISGYSQEELLGQNHRMLNSGHHDKLFFEDLYHTVANGEVWHGEICNKAKDNHVYWVDTTIVPFKGEDGKPQSYIAIRTDITLSKGAELAMIEAKEKAEDAARSKSEFLASMSHEIRTPMNGVLGMLGLLLNTNLDATQRHRTIIAQNSAQSLLVLINDILDFSKVDAGKLELELMDFNLRNMLGEFAEAYALQAEDKNLELILDVTGIEQSVVKGDAGRLRQILTNLVGNAIKFTSQGEIVIRVSLHHIDEQHLDLVCTVTDTGIGIPADKLDHLFDAFSQVDASTTRKYGGTGLGLSICKKITELMGGRISVDTELGMGSSFKFNVILQSCEQSKLVIPKVDISTLDLLIVDDNTTNREVLRGQMEHWGAQVTEAKGADEALALCEQRLSSGKLFDIAFLDMQMPGTNGADLGQKIRTDDRLANMRMVMMTSMGSKGDAELFARLGFSAYFPKPATTSDLFDALSIVAEGGDTLTQAQPLVTRHYLATLDKDDADTAETNVNRWPADTRILLVEDSLVNQMVAIGILNELGLHVDVAENGEEAIRFLTREATVSMPYSVVFMDCQMPVMDGYQATRKIRSGLAGESNLEIPIIAMTANAMSGDKEKCLRCGMNDYLSKPIEPDLVKEKLLRWIPGCTTMSRSEPDPEFSNDTPAPAPAGNDPVTTIWDEQAVLKRLTGQQDLLVNLIGIFLDEYPSLLNEFKIAVETEQTNDAAALIHRIKGMTGNLSALQLHQQSMQLEEVIKQQQLDKVSLLLPAYKVAGKQLTSCLKEYLQHVDLNKEETGQTQNLEELIKLLQQLEGEVHQGNYIEASRLQPLHSFQAEAPLKDLLLQLEKQINNFDFSNAGQTITSILEFCVQDDKRAG